MLLFIICIPIIFRGSGQDQGPTVLDTAQTLSKRQLLPHRACNLNGQDRQRSGQEKGTINIWVKKYVKMLL